MLGTLATLVVWLAFGVAWGSWACLRLAADNPSLRGQSGLVFLAWWSAICCLLSLGVPTVQSVIARLSLPDSRRAQATSITRGALLGVAVIALIVATAGITQGAIRWGFRGLMGAVLAVGIARLPIRIPAWCDRAISLVALALAVWLPWQAAQRIRANVPATHDQPAPTLVNPQTPLLVVGLDGLEWTKIRTLIAARRLPTFERLVANGARAPLRTSQPTWSPIIWNTLSTGLDERGHGIRDFSEMRFPGMDCGVQRLRKQPTLTPAVVGVRSFVSVLYEAGLLDEFPVTGCQRQEPAFLQ